MVKKKIYASIIVSYIIYNNLFKPNIDIDTEYKELEKNFELDNFNNSAIDNSAIDNSAIDNREILNSAIDNSEIDNSEIDNSAIDNSEIDNSEIDNSEILNSEILNSEILNSEIDNIDIDNSALKIALKNMLKTKKHTDWTFLNKINNTKSFYSTMENDYILLKTVVKIDVPLELGKNFLINPENIYKYNKKIKNYKIFEKKDRSYKFSLEYELPFPFKNRELILESDIIESKKSAIIYSTSIKNNIYLKNKKCVTADLKYGGYLIKELDEDNILLISLTAIDFKGSVPKMAIIRKFSEGCHKLANYLQALKD